MATKAELITMLAVRLRHKIRSELTGAQTLSALTGADPQDQQALLLAIRDNDRSAMGQGIDRIMDKAIEAAAVAEATNLLADDTLTLVELERVL